MNTPKFEYEYRTIDKSRWPSGPWNNEPDKVQWTDKATGFPCLAVRQPRSGHWCGYAGVDEGHPFFGRGYDTLGVDVHGGLTFSDRCQHGESQERATCHLPMPGKTDQIWWFGFDCAHLHDIAPAMAKELTYPGSDEFAQYRPLSYVVEQVTSLAKQLFDRK